MTTPQSPQSIEVSVLPWAPPAVHGLVRDLRVRWALEEAGWPYREHLVDSKEKASRSYRALQPFGQVPAFQSAEQNLFESGAIVLHIAEQSPALMPAEPEGRTRVTTWTFGALNTVEPPIAILNFLDIVYDGPKGEDMRAFRASVVSWAEMQLDALVTALEGRDYLLDRFTAADLLLTTVLRAVRHTDLIEARPTLKAFQKRCESRPAFQKALADHMANFAKHAPPAS